MTQEKSDGLLYMVAIFLATLVLASTVRHARSQPFYGDIYDGARANQWRYGAPNVYRAPPLAYAPPPPVSRGTDRKNRRPAAWTMGMGWIAFRYID